MRKATNDLVVELYEMKKRMEDLYEKSRHVVKPRTPPHQPRTPWVPAADVWEEDGRWMLVVDLPGVRNVDLSVEIEAENLVIEGQRQTTAPVRGARCLTSQRPSGSFRLSFPLPEGGDTDEVLAQLENGVLTVSVTKKTTEPRKIPVQASRP